MEAVLSVEDLKTYFENAEGTLRAVDGISFKLHKGKTLGIVGESGCGKSVTSLSILRLVPDPPGKIKAGRILFKGKNVLDLPEKEMRGIRGNQISMIFQEPMTSLNPVFTCGNQIAETIQLHQRVNAKTARQMAIEQLRLVSIPDPEKKVHEYPHQLSGGMRQRVMIAMALACRPDVLIADEPTTALDVTIQAQIIDLLKQLQEQLGMAIIFITHDLGIIAEIADEVAVMYAGKIVEKSRTKRLFENPLHPYTRGLLDCLPKPGGHGRLKVISGQVSDAFKLSGECRFNPRCSEVKDLCRKQEPVLKEIESEHWVSCWER